MKQKKKVNPYEKKVVRKKARLTRTHWILILCAIAIVAFVAVFAIFGPAADPHAGHNHAPGETHAPVSTTVDPHAGHNHAPGETHAPTPTTAHAAH